MKTNENLQDTNRSDGASTRNQVVNPTTETETSKRVSMKREEILFLDKLQLGTANKREIIAMWPEF